MFKIEIENKSWSTSLFIGIIRIDQFRSYFPRVVTLLIRASKFEVIEPDLHFTNHWQSVS